MIMRRHYVLLTLLILVPALPLTATTYYVDQDGVHGTAGNDTYPGTSWNQPWATITKAAQTMVAGDSVIVAAGTYREMVVPVNSGTSDNPIVYYTDEGAVIAGSEPVDETQFMLAPGCAHTYKMNFSLFYVRGVTQLNGPDSIVFRPYLDTTRSVASVEAAPGSFWHDTTNNELYLHTADGQAPTEEHHAVEFTKRSDGFWCEQQQHLRLEGFTLRNQSNPGAAGRAIYLLNCRHIHMTCDTVIGAVCRSYDCTHLRFDACSINRLWRLSTPFSYSMLPHGSSGMSIANCDTVYITNLEVWWQTDAMTISGDCDSIVIEDSKWFACPNHGCILKSHSGPTGRPSNVWLRRCEAGQDCQEGIKFWYCDNVVIENCVLTALNHTYGENEAYHSTNITVRNTIFTHTFPPDHRTMNIWIGEYYYVDEYDMDYNCVYNPEYQTRFIAVGPPNSQKMTLAQWQSFSGQDMHSLCTDPLVITPYPGPGHPDADYHLQHLSPCIDAGDPSYPVPPDHGAFIDIGAYEYDQTAVREHGTDIASRMRICPNPFRNKTVIRYEMRDDSNGEFSVRIYDATGRCVRTLFHTQSPMSNAQSLTWYGDDSRGRPVPAGVYFISLLLDHQRTMSKVLLIR